MITLSLANHKRARIWFDAPGDHLAQPYSSRVFRIARGSRVDVHHKAVAVELFVPAGGRFEYGLLGASAVVSVSTGDGLDIEIPVTGSEGPMFHGSLAGQLDTVRWGLPAEYADAVQAGAEEFVGSVGAPVVSRVRFDWAAHGLVGSNNPRFRRLARLVIQLLITPNDADLNELVERA